MARTDPNAISIYRGDSYPIRFTLKDKATGLPLDLTAADLTLTVDTLQSPPDDTTKVFEVAGVLSDTPTDGTVTFIPTTTDTDTAGSYFYDVELVQGGNVRTVVKSSLTITMDITK